MTNDTTITPELLDQLLANYEKPEDLTGADGLFKQLKKALIERALGAELSDHLGYEKGDPAGRGSGNSRNGAFAKTILTEEGEIEHRCATRPGWQLRAAIDRQGPDPFRWLRRQNPEPLRARHDGARDPGAFIRTLWRRGLAGFDQPGDRRGSRRSPGMANPPARPGLSGGVFRRAAGQDSR